jgi:hypothetical protein
MTDVEAWLHHANRRWRNRELFVAAVCLLAAPAIFVLTGALATWLLFEEPLLMLESPLTFLVVAGGCAFLCTALYLPFGRKPAGALTWRRTPSLPLPRWTQHRNHFAAAENPRAALTYVGDVFFAGPRAAHHGLDMLLAALRRGRLRVRPTAAVLDHLLEHDHRRSFEQIAAAVPGIDLEGLEPDLRQIEGLVFLTSDPPGLALGTELRAEMARALGLPDRART